MDIEGAFLYQNSFCFAGRKRNPNLRVQPAIATFCLSKVQGSRIGQKGLRALALHIQSRQGIFFY